jgi:uroporphyrin-3 C-methyltransferase
MQKDKSTRDSESGDDSTQTQTDAVQLNIPPSEPEAETESAAESGAESGAEASKPDDAPLPALPEPDAESTEQSDAAPQGAAGDQAKAETEADKAGATAPAEKAGSKADSKSQSKKADQPVAESPAKPAPPPREKPRGSWFGLFNFLLILALAGAGGYYWYLQQQVTKQMADDYEATIADLRGQINAKPSNAQLIDEIEPMRRVLGQFTRQIQQLETEQESLEQASVKLYELYGRNKNEWQLAEVEYLMRVAQHKLILQDDFSGAAITLQAASDLLGETGDPGMVPVRVMISEEIADLRTRKRADLVGMTLILAQLSGEVLTLRPGFPLRIDETPPEPEAADPAPPPLQGEQTWLEQVGSYLDSLVEIRHESLPPTPIEASVADVGQILSDNLKLARWAVLERDVHHYEMLLERSVQLFRDYYDLDNAANADFLRQLTDLQKRVLKPEKPDITGSLREMTRILQQRELDPVEAPEAGNNPEANNG